MLPTCLSRHMRGSGFDGLPTAFDTFRPRHAWYRWKACCTPFWSMVFDRSHEALRLKTPARKALPATSLVELQNSELRPFGRTSSTGPHTSGCRPFEINTFPAVVTLIADFGLVCAQRGRGRDSATPECFGRGSQGTIFVRSSKLSLFFPELCSFRRVFLFPALL